MPHVGEGIGNNMQDRNSSLQEIHVVVVNIARGLVVVCPGHEEAVPLLPRIRLVVPVVVEVSVHS